MLVFVGVPGFSNAWVSKTIFLTIGFVSILASITGMRPSLTMYYDGVLYEYEVWRVATSHMVFGTPCEALLGLLLLYYFRAFERQLSSRKYATFVLLASALSSALQLGALTLLRRPLGLLALLPGPYGLIYAGMVKFHYQVPHTYTFHLGSFPLTDKAFVYLLAAQLALASGLHSLLVAACGLAAGMLYRSDLGGIHSWVIPIALSSKCSYFVLPILQPLPSLPRLPGSSSPQEGASTDPSPDLIPAIPFRIPLSAFPSSLSSSSPSLPPSTDIHDLFQSSDEEEVHPFPSHPPHPAHPISIHGTDDLV